ncbi:MAG: AMP-binding protein [Rhizobiaceae bacterium]|nr:AMP-binding protein [Rhizobiaceae bacterium]
MDEPVAEPLGGWTVPGLLQARALGQGDRAFLLGSDGALSYRAACDRALDWSAALESAGVMPGDRVAFLLKNRFDTPTVWLGIMCAGGAEVPLNAHQPAAFQKQMIDLVAPKVLIVDTAFAEQLPAELPDSVISVIWLDETQGYAPRSGAHRARVEEMQLPTPDMLAAILPTSGTTGKSKGVMLSHRFMRRFAMTQATSLGIRHTDRHYSCLPQFHAGGQVAGVLVHMTAGASVYIADKFSRSNFWTDVRRTGATTTVALGGMLSLLESLEPTDAEGGLRLIHAVPAPSDQSRRLEERWRCLIRTNFGSTEAGIVISQPLDRPVHGSVGRQDRHVDLEIRSDSLERLGVGEVGHVWVRPHHRLDMFSGYWSNPEATERAFRDGWFCTGDRARADGDGNYYFIDRDQDVIRRRGEHVSAAELESIVLTHPAIDAVAAVAVPSELGESDVALFVVRRAGGDLDETGVLRFCAGLVPYYMIPRYVRFIAELPLTETLKVQKSKLRELAADGTSWDSETHGFRITSRGLVTAHS